MLLCPLQSAECPRHEVKQP